MECCKCISMKKAGRRSSMKNYFHGLRGLGHFHNKLKRHLYVQMHCLPISDIYVVSVEFYAGIGHKRLLMTKELQSIWRIRKMENTKYDDKFYRLSKRLFKEEQFRSMTNEARHFI